MDAESEFRERIFWESLRIAEAEGNIKRLVCFFRRHAWKYSTSIYPLWMRFSVKIDVRTRDGFPLDYLIRECKKCRHVEIGLSQKTQNLTVRHYKLPRMR